MEKEWNDGKHPRIGELKIGDKVLLRADLTNRSDVPYSYDPSMTRIAEKVNKYGGVIITSVTPREHPRGRCDEINFDGSGGYVWNNCMVQKKDVLEEIKKMTL